MKDLHEKGFGTAIKPDAKGRRVKIARAGRFYKSKYPAGQLFSQDVFEFRHKSRFIRFLKENIICNKVYQTIPVHMMYDCIVRNYA